MLQVYGLEHLLYLVITVPLFIFAIFMIKRYVKSTVVLDRTVKIIGLIYVLIMIWNRISISMLRDGWDNFIPNLYCGISGIALSISLLVLKRDHIIFHCLIYISILGGLLTMIYPDFIVYGDSLFFQPTLSGLIHHSFLLFVPVLLVAVGYVKPTMKYYLALPLGMAVYITFGVFELTVLNYESAMYLFEPVLANTMFDWFGFTVLFLPTHFLFLVLWKYLPVKYKPTSLYDLTSVEELA